MSVRKRGYCRDFSTITGSETPLVPAPKGRNKPARGNAPGTQPIPSGTALKRRNTKRLSAFRPRAEPSGGRPRREGGETLWRPFKAGVIPGSRSPGALPRAGLFWPLRGKNPPHPLRAIRVNVGGTRSR